jgi:hypothetical protein
MKAARVTPLAAVVERASAAFDQKKAELRFLPSRSTNEGIVMNTTVIATCATSLLVGLAAWTAAADDLPARSTADVEVVFKSLDRNRDRKISRSEASVKGSVSKRFDGIDSDGDGYLSKQEFAARPSSEPFE